MTKVVRKWFLVHNYQKEEDWLNEMAAQGYRLKKVALGKYMFEETTKDETVRMVFMDQNKEEFIEFMEDMDIEHVDTLSNWGYFRKENMSEEPKFEMFSDNESRIKHLSNILKMLLMFLAMNLFSAYSNLAIGEQVPNTWSVVVGILSLCVSFFVALVAYKMYMNIKALKENNRIQH
ncbi:DUF2812 domain-containing protein [Macrococcus bovicus]|uniref:DUF2812 domain-containing protein n=1 Tax=Macrococcus bovicus TaxID=69968 RepID=UPI0025A4EC2A|nr:DUF2812 domain-containing protein [Macrococcus bovicus]WJP97306.1 DUF2812 domain-containing protein [Macrococcus bovicus]